MGRATGSRNKVRRSSPAIEQAWQSMRVLRRFGAADLVTTGEISLPNARKYMRGLVRGGFIRLVQPRRAGLPGESDIYLLVRDTGPRAPVLRTNGQVYDINTDTVHGEARE